MVVPVRSYAGLLKMRAGITAYEKLGAVEGPDLHQNWGVSEIEREEPAIDASVYKHACAYREYLTDDAHLVLANLRSAAGLGAAVLNHARVEAIVQDREPRRGGRGRLPPERAPRARARPLRDQRRRALGRGRAPAREPRRAAAPAPLEGRTHRRDGRTAAGPESPVPEHAGPPLDLRDPPGPLRGDRHHRHQLRAGGRRVARDHARGRRVPAGAARSLPARREARGRGRDRRLGGAAPADRAAGKEALRDLAARRGAGGAGGRRHHGRRKAHRLPAARAGDGRARRGGRLAADRAGRPGRTRRFPAATSTATWPALEIGADARDGRQRRRGRAAGAAARHRGARGGARRDPGAGARRARERDRISPSARKAPPRSRTCSTAACGRRSTRAARARPPWLPRPSAWRRLLGWDAARSRPRCEGVRAQLAADLAFRDEAPSGVARAAGAK